MKRKYQNNRTNPVLFIACFLLCAGCGVVVTQPKAGSSPMTEAGVSDIIAEASLDAQTASLSEEAAEGTSDSGAASEEALQTDDQAPAESGETSVSVTTEEAASGDQTDAGGAAPAGDSAQAAASSTDSTQAAGQNEAQEPGTPSYVSPEASTGSWSKADSEWFFVVDGHNHHGWLYDTDGHVYYLNPENGVMTTGWATIDGKTYCFSPDGVMQTGDVESDGQIYHLNEDGTLDQAAAPVPVAAPEIIITAAPAPSQAPAAAPPAAEQPASEAPAAEAPAAEAPAAEAPATEAPAQ